MTKLREKLLVGMLLLATFVICDGSGLSRAEPTAECDSKVCIEVPVKLEDGLNINCWLEIAVATPVGYAYHETYADLGFGLVPKGVTGIDINSQVKSKRYKCTGKPDCDADPTVPLPVSGVVLVYTVPEGEDATFNTRCKDIE